MTVGFTRPHHMPIMHRPAGCVSVLRRLSACSALVGSFYKLRPVPQAPTPTVELRTVTPLCGIHNRSPLT